MSIRATTRALLTPAILMLIVGTKTQTILEHLPETFLLIDDGPIIDRLTFPKRRKVTRFNPDIHHFNPLKDIDYKRAREFIDILDAIFPEGANTLTKKNANFILLKALLDRQTTLDKLLSPSDDPYEQDAFQKIATLLLSPILRNALCHSKNFSLTGILIARLDRAKLGDFDCFVLGNLLASLYQGTVVFTDFGFYACPSHISLIRQNRLIAGIRTLSAERIKPLLQELLFMPDKKPAGTTYDDAETLAIYSGVSRATTGFSDYVASAMKG